MWNKNDSPFKTSLFMNSTLAALWLNLFFFPLFWLNICDMKNGMEFTASLILPEVYEEWKELTSLGERTSRLRIQGTFYSHPPCFTCSSRPLWNFSAGGGYGTCSLQSELILLSSLRKMNKNGIQNNDLDQIKSFRALYFTTFVVLSQSGRKCCRWFLQQSGSSI